MRTMAAQGAREVPKAQVVPEAHVQEEKMTRTTREQCVVTATPGAEDQAQPGVLPPGAPLQFQWRGSRYRVLDILGHWLDTAPWWWRMQSGAVQSSAVGPASDDPHVTSSGSGHGVRPRTRRVWQVEAVNQRTAQPGVYELAQDVAGGQWWLLRVWD